MLVTLLSKLVVWIVLPFRRHSQGSGHRQLFGSYPGPVRLCRPRHRWCELDHITAKFVVDLDEMSFDLRQLPAHRLAIVQTSRRSGEQHDGRTAVKSGKR